MHINKIYKNIEEVKLNEYVDLYLKVFTRKPWYEDIEFGEIKELFLKILDMNTFLGYEFLVDNKLVGVSIGYLKPWIKGYEYYIDQFYIDYSMQNKGYGKKFLELLESKLDKTIINSIILNSERDLPAYKFYLNNGFEDLYNLKTLIKEI